MKMANIYMERVGVAPYLIPLSYSTPIYHINVTNLITLKPRHAVDFIGRFSQLSWVRSGRHERTVTLIYSNQLCKSHCHKDLIRLKLILLLNIYIR
jgi:hypothetical protein